MTRTQAACGGDVTAALDVLMDQAAGLEQPEPLRALPPPPLLPLPPPATEPCERPSPSQLPLPSSSEQSTGNPLLDAGSVSRRTQIFKPPPPSNCLQAALLLCCLQEQA